MNFILTTAILLFVTKTWALSHTLVNLPEEWKVSHDMNRDLDQMTVQGNDQGFSERASKGRERLKCGKGKSLKRSCTPTCAPKSNQMAERPPMGWLAWERFRCKIDCVRDPEHCISERLFMRMADSLVKDGYADVGYDYIIIDDCWIAQSRDKYGRLQPDPDRFPSGIKALADYIHSKGLKFGIYQDIGNLTCAGYPGILGHFELDAQTFADWGVDYIKIDGCYADPVKMDQSYQEFGQFLKKTGRKIVYSCSYPAYQIYSNMTVNFTTLKKNCNLWRLYGDIDDSWQSVEYIIDIYGEQQNIIAQHAGPGHWNDPDMLIIGNFGLSFEQSKAQMGLWAIWAAPLLMSNDLKTVKPEYRAILQNKRVIRVNQDILGIQGRQIYKKDGLEVWVRPISPVVYGAYSFAYAFLSRRTDGTPIDLTLTLKSLGLTYSRGYKVMDLFENKYFGVLSLEDSVSICVNPTGIVMLRFKLVQ